MPSIRRPRRPAVAVALVILVALSGCAGLTDTGSSTAEPLSPTPSPTPASSPAPTETSAPPTEGSPSTTPTATQTPTSPTGPTPTAPSNNRLAPGVAESGFQNATRAILGHQTVAADTPGVVTHTTNSTVQGQAVIATVRVTATSDLTRVQYVAQAQTRIENETENTTTVIAANDTSVRQYTVNAGNVTLDNRRERTQLFDRALRGLSTATSPLQGTFRRGNFTITGVTDRGDTSLVTLHADRFAGGQLYSPQNVVAYNATIRLTTDGLVRSVTERIAVQRNGRDGQYDFTYRFNERPVDLPAAPQVPADIRTRSNATMNE